MFTRIRIRPAHALLRTALTCLAWVLACSATPDSSGSRGFALVLSGGGARGLAQIGVIRALEEDSLRPSLVVGTSMGAVIGAMYAAGHTSQDIERFARSIDWNTVFANSAQRPKLLVNQKAEPVDYLVELRFESGMKPILPNSISHGQNIYDIMARVLAPAQYRAGGNYDSLAIPLRIVTTDILTGRAVVLASGNLATALRASSGVPLAFSPVKQGECLLMDGGLTANIPVSAALERRCSLIVAVNVTSPLWRMDQLDSPVRLMDQVVAIGIAARKLDEEAKADLVIRPDLEGFANTDFTTIDTLIARGYAAGKAHISWIREHLPASTDTMSRVPLRGAVRWTSDDTLLCRRLDSSWNVRTGGAIDRAAIHLAVSRAGVAMRRPYMHVTSIQSLDSVTLVTVDRGLVRAVSVSGNQHTSTRLITAAIAIQPGSLLRENSIPLAMSTLYATGLFHTVNIDLDSNGTLRIFVQEKPYTRARVGLRFDDYLLGEAYVEPAYENLFGVGLNAVLHLQYGLRREKYALEFSGNQLFSPWWASNLSIQGYIAREAIVTREETPDPADTTGDRHIISYEEQSLRKAGVAFMLGTELGKTVMLSGGIRLERFESFATGGSVFADGLGPFTRLRYIMGSLTIDNLDRWPYATKGHRHHITVGGAHDALSQTESFVKIDAGFSYFVSFLNRHTISPQITLGWSSYRLPIVERFYLGGMPPEERYRELGVYNYQPFMGLKPRALTGDLLATARLAYQVRIARKLYVHAALDYGTTWQQPGFVWSTQSLRALATEAPLGLGIGASYDSPIGPLRFTWSRLLNHVSIPDEQITLVPDNQFYISVGHDF